MLGMMANMLECLVLDRLPSLESGRQGCVRERLYIRGHQKRRSKIVLPMTFNDLCELVSRKSLYQLLGLKALIRGRKEEGP